jgi:hypothetical protein
VGTPQERAPRLALAAKRALDVAASAGGLILPRR